MDTPQKPAKNQPTIENPNEVEAVYANLVRIAHSPSELILDFAHLIPGSNSAQIRTRVIMSPLGAKLLQRALSENLKRFETNFGEIKVPGESSLADHLFRPMSPPDSNSDDDQKPQE